MSSSAMTSAVQAAAARSPAQITVVTAPACHFCRDALDALAEIGATFPIEVTELDVRTPIGMVLMQQHGAAMSPLVLMDGAFVSAGRLPRGKLASLLLRCEGQVTS